jgi:hypothetical protein
MSKHIPNKPDKYYQGKYTPENPDKYLGDISDIWFRSMWEFSFCYYCDHEDRVKKWACEPEQHKIQYDVIENEQYTIKTYIPDFWMIVEKSNNDEEEFLIEIKPEKELYEPKEPKKVTVKSLENYEYRLKTYYRNRLKWEAAEKYCEKRGMGFFLLTEKYFEKTQIKLF